MTSTTFQNEYDDEPLSLRQIKDVNGGGFWSWLKNKVKQKSKDIEKKYGDGDGKHELSDYWDELEDIIQPPCNFGPCPPNI